MKEGKKMKKFITFIYVSFFILCFSFSIMSEFGISIEDLNLNPNDYARITDVDYTAVLVDEPGSLRKSCSYRKSYF